MEKVGCAEFQAHEILRPYGANALTTMFPWLTPWAKIFCRYAADSIGTPRHLLGFKYLRTNRTRYPTPAPHPAH